MTQTLVLASGNAGKLAELRTYLAGLPFDCRPQSDFTAQEAEETGKTFVENAILKARFAAAAANAPALADDSGLCVDALDGVPGIYSARYAGPHGDHAANIVKLLAELEGVDMDNRSAHFHCTLVLLQHAEDPDPVIAQANWYGQIALQPSGRGGFGYDPVFLLPDQRCTAAELAPAQKAAIGHRGQALAQLVAQLKGRLKLLP